MKHTLPPLDALKVFECAARHLSFSQAATELCITKGAVSYQIRKLEENLDCALFKRSVRQVYLTDAGQTLLQSSQKWFDDMTLVFDQIKPYNSTHTVMVGATTYVALRWLSPLITEFGKRSPDIAILLQHSVNADDFRMQDVDFAIHWCAMEEKTSRGRLLELPMPLFPVCSPELLIRHGHNAEKKALKTSDLTGPAFGLIPLLCEDRSLDLWQHWYDGKKPLSNPRRTIADANVRTQAAIDGQGWTLADNLMRRELDSGLLVAPFKHALNGYGYAIETSAGRYLGQDAQALRDWLIEFNTPPTR